MAIFEQVRGRSVPRLRRCSAFNARLHLQLQMSRLRGGGSC